IDRLDQEFQDFIRFCRTGGIDHQPSVDRIDPDPGLTLNAEGARQQFVGDVFLDFLLRLRPGLEPLCSPIFPSLIFVTWLITVFGNSFFSVPSKSMICLLIVYTSSPFSRGDTQPWLCISKLLQA